MVNSKKLPYNLEAEQSVLGAILVEESNIARAEEILSPQDFYSSANRKIFECMVALYEQRQSIDAVTLINLLKNRGVYEEIGGGPYIAEIVTIVPSYRNFEEYCRIVEEKSTLRKLISSASDILKDSYGTFENVDGIIESAEKRIFEVSQGKKSKDFANIKDTLADTILQIESIAQNKGKLTGLSTGFKELDIYTAGLQKADLIILAARPSMGKTAFALNLAAHAAVKERASVAIFSLEMSKEQLVQRMLCSLSYVDSSKIRTGDLTAQDWENINNGYSELYNTRMFIDDTAGVTLSEIRSKCRRLKLDQGLDFIVIDYLQLMQSKNPTDNRQGEISEISRGLKILAREMECPLICLSQLSRAPEKRVDRHPMLADLRESGSIEQDADMVIFLYRDYYYNKDDDKKKHLAELDVAKQRNGPTGRIDLAWLPQYTRFSDLAVGYSEEE